MLLTSTTWWPFTARIALRFAALGWRVEAVCPAGHPLRATQAVSRAHRYAALRPVGALRAAIAAARPDLIVPCDDRAAVHLHELRAQPRAEDAVVTPAVARSLGAARSDPITERRAALIRIARESGVRAPQTRPVGDAAELRAAVAELGLPLVLKVDGTWGGFGVMVVRSEAEAERARVTLARRLSAARALKRLLFDRDPYHLRPWLTRAVPRVSAQAFVAGRSANSLAACWNGEVLACIHVEVVRTRGRLGASTVVRVIDHPEMTLATERLVRRLGLSGFCGLDFMIEDTTGHAHLVEMNPRATPLCHLALGPGRDPIAALTARLCGAPPSALAPVTDNPVIAFFPQAWHATPHSELLRTGYHDVPWEDPILMRELMRLPYPDRGALARLLAWLQRACPALRRHEMQ